jgi:urease accessory protein
MMSKRRLSMALAGLAGLALSLPAAAHPGHGETGLAAGLLHPFSGSDHLLALLAVGLWSRQQGVKGHGGALAPAFLIAMALGASTGLAPSALETSVAATVLLLGGLAASGLRFPPQLAVLMVGGCGFLHGLAHGQELSGMASGAGFLVASTLLMGVGALLGHRLRPLLRRFAGAAIGAAGLCLLAGVV